MTTGEGDLKSAPESKRMKEVTKECRHDGDLSRNSAGGLMCDECGEQIEDFWEDEF